VGVFAGPGITLAGELKSVSAGYNDLLNGSVPQGLSNGKSGGQGKIDEFHGVRMLTLNPGVRSSSHLARFAIMHAAFLALAGSALGVFAILQRAVTGAETVVVLSSGLFGSGLLVTLFVFRRVKMQTLATASTTYYGLYLCAGMIVALGGLGNHSNLFTYMVWFFPLMVFNNLVNSPSVGRFLARFLMVAPTVILVAFSPRFTSLFPVESLILAVAGVLSYICFGLMLNAVSRYREAYIIEQERADSMRIESEVLESISDCFISLDSEFKLIYLNDAACSEFSVERSAALNGTIPDAIPGFFSSSMLNEMRNSMGQASAHTFEAQNEMQDQWYVMRCYPRTGGLAVYFGNITEPVLSRRKLEVANDRMREQSELLDNAQDAIFVQDRDSRILYWNKGAERMFGWTAEEAMGRQTEEIFPCIFPEVEKIRAFVLEHGEWTGELQKRHKNGRALTVESRCTLLRGDDGKPRSMLAINTDITDRKVAEARIHQLAFYDPLTGLPNRVLLRDRLEKTLAAPMDGEKMGALLLLDLDDFKTLNDTSGHDIGDLLLQEVALRLASDVRKTDFTARLGSDEFMVILEGLSADAEKAAVEAKAVGDLLLMACQQHYLLGSYEYDGTVSIGVTLFKRQKDAADDMLKRADLAMYRAKARGRNTVCFFDPAMETSAASRAALLADLNKAMQNRDFELYYQPQMDSGGRVTGAEALIRWRHAERGMVPPGEFIPLAESAGLIVELGLWVLEAACAQLAKWARQPETEGLTLAVNVSIRQFLDSHFVHLVEETLRESGANPHRLKLEITESLILEKATDTIAKMTALKAHGISFSMDDFGTGYSSLSQLRQLPLDQLKIDQSFIRDVLNCEKDAAIVSTIIALGRSLNLSVIAEGVETEGQRNFLENEGCHVYQGYLFSRALPASQFDEFVNEAGQLNVLGAA
jgi:diguanylate cyclase (GGDEF)-like protein/PAS domain S-box-containing protein